MKPSYGPILAALAIGLVLFTTFRLSNKTDRIVHTQEVRLLDGRKATCVFNRDAMSCIPFKEDP
jgi:hypothetical protein